MDELVTKSAQMLHRLLPARIELITDVASGAPVWVYADSAQLQQVVMNLAINARDAMPEGGTIAISVTQAKDEEGRQSQDGEPVAPDHELEPGEGVARLVVSDTGSGISQEVQEHMFEPFYSTKSRGQGTGLGLSIIHGIVKDHGGRIDVDSELGRGTTITVELPVHVKDAAWGIVESSPGVPSGRGETILLAEDDWHVRAVLSTGLESFGYEVIQAGSGPSLLECFERHRDRIRLLVVDIDLPKRSGLKCLQDLRASGVRTPAILVTAKRDANLTGALDKDTLLLHKPFQIAELGAMAESVLCAPSGKGGFDV